MSAGQTFGLLAAVSAAAISLSADPAFAGRGHGSSCGPGGRSYSNCRPSHVGGFRGCSSGGLSVRVGFSSGGGSFCGSFSNSSCGPFFRPFRPVCRPSPRVYSGWSSGWCAPVFAPTVIYTVPVYTTRVSTVDTVWNDSPAYATAQSNVNADAAYRQWQREQAAQVLRGTDGQASRPLVAAAPAPAPEPTPPVPAVEPAASPTGPSGVTQESLSAAWGLLAQGESQAGLTAFARLCDGNLGWAPPKAGYAIAAAMEGKADTAAWGLRRAFAENPDALGFLPTTPGLEARMADLSVRLRGQAATQTGPAAGETWFLIAGIDYLRHDISGATQAARQAQDLGQDHVAMRNLLSLLN